MPSPALTCYFDPPTARGACHSAYMKHRFKGEKSRQLECTSGNNAESEVFAFSECWNNGNWVGILSKFLFIFNFKLKVSSHLLVPKVRIYSNLFAEFYLRFFLNVTNSKYLLYNMQFARGMFCFK